MNLVQFYNRLNNIRGVGGSLLRLEDLSKRLDYPGARTMAGLTNVLNGLEHELTLLKSRVDVYLTVEGMTPQEIADATGSLVSTVQSNIDYWERTQPIKISVLKQRLSDTSLSKRVLKILAQNNHFTVCDLYRLSLNELGGCIGLGKTGVKEVNRFLTIINIHLVTP